MLGLNRTPAKKKNQAKSNIKWHFIICDTKFEQNLSNPCPFFCILDSETLNSKQLKTTVLQQ